MNKKSNKFSPEVRERAVRMVQEHRGEYPSLWAAIESVLSRCRLMNVFGAGTHASSSDGTDFSCQRVKLVGKRPFVAALHHELTFANHVHQLDASQDIFGRSK